MLLVQPESGDPWIGTFAFGVIVKAGITRILSTPNPNVICVVANGEGYLVEASNPEKCEDVRATPVLDIRQVMARSLIVFADFTTLVAYDHTGIKWKSSRIGSDDLTIMEVTDNHIRGTWWNPATSTDAEFVVDLETGELVGGTRCYW